MSFRAIVALSAVAFVLMLAYSAARDAGWVGPRNYRPIEPAAQR